MKSGSRTAGKGISHIGHTAPAPARAIRVLVLLAIACCGPLAPASHAQAYAVNLDPAQTKIAITLGSTLHTVHGTFQLKSGQMHFDTATGKATGAIVVDATSGNTDDKGRDKKMHQEILESQKYPEIIFTPVQVHGTFDPQKASQVDVAGKLQVHGQDHDVTLTFATQPAAGKVLACDTKFTIPYKKWGMKDPSTFLLHANDIVDLEIHAAAQITSDQPSH